MFNIFNRKKKFRQLPQTTISQSTGTNNDGFGGSVALSSNGTTIAVGTPYDDVGANTNQGSVTIFTRSNNILTEQQIITAGESYGQFGYSVALSSDGNTLAVGANQVSYYSGIGPTYLNVGAVYIWTRSSGTWSLQKTINGANFDYAGNDFFGHSVALSSDGDTVLIGAFYKTVSGRANQGAAYVFTRAGTTWTQQQKLTQSTGAANDYFGMSVALSSNGNTALIGAYQDDIGSNADQGSATVFTRSSGVWTEQQTLTQSNGQAGDFFGCSVALSSDGNTALVGASQDDIGVNSDQGSATVFTRSGTTWTQQQTLTQSTGAAADSFGGWVSLSGDGNTALIGASAANVGGFGDVGLITVFTRSNNLWTEQKILSQTSGTASDYFGMSVALSSDGKVSIGGAQYGVVGSNPSQGNATIFYRR